MTEFDASCPPVTDNLHNLDLAIDNMLRGCDLVVLRVDGVAPGGYVADRATVRQN